jgi:hypothetical protein
MPSVYDALYAAVLRLPPPVLKRVAHATENAMAISVVWKEMLPEKEITCREALALTAAATLDVMGAPVRQWLEGQMGRKA